MNLLDTERRETENAKVKPVSRHAPSEVLLEVLLYVLSPVPLAACLSVPACRFSDASSGSHKAAAASY
jgi:hypothetical protein